MRKEFWFLCIIPSVGIDWYLASELATIANQIGCSGHFYMLLHAINPLAITNAVTIPSFYIQYICISLLSTTKGFRQLNSLIRVFLCMLNPLHVFLLCPTNIYIVGIVFVLGIYYPPANTYSNPFALLYSSAHSEFLDSVQYCIAGITVIPYICYVMEERITSILLYLPILCYGEGIYSMAYAFPLLAIRSFPTTFLLLCLHLFSISLYYDLCIEGEDIFSLSFYIQCITCGWTFHLISQQTKSI